MAYRSRRVLSVLALALLLILSLSACGPAKRPAGKAASPRYGGTINYFLGEPVAIDPAFVTEGEGIEVVKQLFDGLVDYDPKTLALKPAVARRWSSNKAGNEWTFWLRRGVRFHNGREVT
ncbi:MAG: ABC transporter substrate-binding protein, partial [Actinomycetota bacterium]|nr:ABC transporter substrate-binding protein [Actinomycetota bacterium]